MIGTPAGQPTVTAAVPTWATNDQIPLGPGKSLRVVEVRESEDPSETSVLVVERV